jgi:predicted dienelactone hydrolase
MMSISTKKRVRATRVSAAVLLAAGLTAAACAPAPSGTQSAGSSNAPGGTTGTVAPTTTMPSVLAGRPNEVVHEQRTFVDASRKTPAGKSVGGIPGTPELPSRTLVTEIYHPAAPGPRPLIMFSHGSNGHPEKFTRLLNAWAAAGYVVAAPAFPLTNSHAPAGYANNFDVWDQPRDISFVLDQVLAASTTPGDALNGRIDPGRIGAAGLSLGGATTYSLAFNECCREPRFKAYEVFAGALLPMPKEYVFDHSVPLLIMHGDNDPTLPYSGAADAYVKAKPPKYFVTLQGALHAPAFEDFPDWDAKYHGLVDKTTVAFWDVYLAGETKAPGNIESFAVVPGVSTMQQQQA